MDLLTFDGEPSEELHEHYDAAGNLTGSTVVTRPGWSDESRAWALGLATREANECRRCGGDLHETLDDDYMWRPLPPAICKRCVGLRNAAKKHEKHDDAASMLHLVEKVAKPKPGKRRR